MAVIHHDIRLTKITTKPRFKNANITRNKFPKQQQWKEYPRENKTKVPEV